MLQGYAKISSNFSFLSKQCKAITVCWCKQPTLRSFQTYLYCIYLFKLYNKSIIILLTNTLTNIWMKISKIRLILWMGDGAIGGVKKRLWHRRFLLNFVKLLRTLFLTEHFQWLHLKGLEEVEKLGRNECVLHCWPRSVTIFDYTSKSKAL